MIKFRHLKVQELNEMNYKLQKPKLCITNELKSREKRIL